MKAVDIHVGDRFGHWTVLETGLRNGKDYKRACKCKCDCGTIRIIDNTSLNVGRTKSCGCHNGIPNPIRGHMHGYSHTRLGDIWKGMNDRCRNPRSDNYAKYGAKGIDVCPEWHDFLPFRDWALSHGYRDDLSIDRIDGTKGYSPENCRWATYEEQSNNLCWNVNLTLGGKTQSMSKWSRELNIPISTIYSRLLAGWDEVDALTRPIDKRKSTKKKKEARSNEAKTNQP